jgi:hypothetical protein
VWFSTGDETMNIDEVCYQVSSKNTCKWFFNENHAKKLYLYELARPGALPVCVKIVIYGDGREERTPHHFD